MHRAFVRAARHLLLLLALLAGTTAQAVIVYNGATHGRNGALPTDGTPGALTIARPPGIGPGQALVASIAARPRSMTAVPPPDWVQMSFSNQVNGGASTAPGGMTLVTYFKIIGLNEPASYTWTFANPANAGGSAVGGIMAFSGMDTAGGNPIDNGWVDELRLYSSDLGAAAVEAMMAERHACSYEAVGMSFAATVTAVDSAGNATPNFGQESAPATVSLGSSLVLPAGGNHPALQDGSSFGAFSAGVASGSNFVWSEAGIIQLTPSLVGSDYLGAGNVSGTVSANVGRLVPHHFDVAVTPACSGIFSYVGQPFDVTVTARNGLSTPSTTQNYSASSGFARAVTLSEATVLGVGSLSGSAVASSASAITLAAGQGLLSLAAPLPAGSSVSFDLALNLGSSTADLSCHAAHPASTGAAKPWLRSRNGACATGWDRDPGARASLGVFAPETRRIVHARELF